MKKRLIEHSSDSAKVYAVGRQIKIIAVGSQVRHLPAAIGGEQAPGADAWQKPRAMELTMSEYQDPRTSSQPRSGPREQLERLYRDIGIPAVAAAAAQMARTEKK